MAQALTETEKMVLRKVRFNNGINMSQTDAQKMSLEEKEKMMERKKRFNLVDNSDEEQKRFERAKRFGLSQKNEEDQKLEERKRRFGTQTPIDENEAIQQRKERFKDQYDEPIQNKRMFRRPKKQFGIRMKRNIKFTRDQKGFRKRNLFKNNFRPKRRFGKFRRIN